MEPAGSQGVWNLDDFQFVPFIWGASQLAKNARVKPKSIDDYDIAQMLAQDYLFFSCIKFISEVKTGPFAEHSNQLWNISGVPTWEQVQNGLIKMYRAEVLCKFPVIQHVFFGSVFTLAAAENPIPELTISSVPKPRGFDPVAGKLFYCVESSAPHNMINCCMINERLLRQRNHLNN
jgi:serine/threonine-protein phosphatase 2A activator